MTQERLIKKYPNRRLYDTSQSCYITLGDVKELVMQEENFKVIDRQSGEDITRSILLQIIMEQESGGQPLFTADLLSQLIRNYGLGMPQDSFSQFMVHNLEAFRTQQNVIHEQMRKTLSGTPMDTWLQMNEKNMQAWTQMQQAIVSSITPEAPEK